MMSFLLLLFAVGIFSAGADRCVMPKAARNVASRGEASQSSTYGNSVARLAIDGNMFHEHFKGSCSHTNKDDKAWWKVDFKKTEHIAVVIVGLRMDCCTDRCKGAFVTLGNSPDPTQNAACGIINDVSKPKIAICCNGKSGQFLGIYLPRADYLSLCWVKAFRDPCILPEGARNVALGGEASQSSTYGNSVARLAIDGNMNTDHFKGSCSHTNKDDKAWWKVDFKKKEHIGVVNVWNRMDCCPERLYKAFVTLGDSPDPTQNTVCGIINDVSKPKVTVCCNGMNGQFLGIYIPGTSHLSVCEVQAFTL